MSGRLLEDVDESLLPLLGQALWSWTCAVCNLTSKQQCSSEACPLRRVDRLHRYLQFYKGSISMYINEADNESSRVLKTHDDIFAAVGRLRSQPDISRASFQQDAFRRRQDSSAHDPSDLRKATSLVVRVLLMIESSPSHCSSDRLERGTCRIPWGEHVGFSKYVQDLFPLGQHPNFSSPDWDVSDHMGSALWATNLTRLGISFHATHDVRNHLRFDRKNDVLEIFHHTAFLKEHLRATKGTRDGSNPTQSIKAGALPRGLVLEILDSIQDLLFPLNDPKSKKLLQSLMKSCSLDPDIINFEKRTSGRGDGEVYVPYVFLADRLSELSDVVENPRPRGWLDRQLQRRSGARYMMKATLVGVVFAVVLGSMALVVSCVQTWIAYQAWKHPVAPAG